MRLISLFALSAGLLSATSCTNPKSQAAMVQALNDAANEISGLRNDLAQIQTEVDSMRTVMAKQDTTIQHLAAVANVPITR